VSDPVREAPPAAPELSTLQRVAGASKRGRPDGPPDGWTLLAAWGPCGYVPVAPGTAGTLGAIPLFWFLRDLPLPLYLLTTVAFIALASYASHRAGRYWKVVDASQIVIDEVAGYLVTMAFVPWSWPAAVAGFVFFRIFDVLKPWPASHFDRKVKNGFGVVMDDVMAGVWSAAAMEVLMLGIRLWRGCEGGLHWWCSQLTP
jgi:phosphatidylglycerophosphatase A